MVTVTASWPPLNFEERRWDWAEHGSRPSRREDGTFRAYRAAIPPEIASGLIRQPVITIEAAREIVLEDTGRAVADKNVYEAIERLVGAGILVEMTRQRRNRAWVANDVLDLLERFQRDVSKQRRLPDSLR
ncbi:hypothetical protein LZC95_46175 [Pendulispora brunnea]|uniref:Uncharacterized protein n=1 Tax=Pendulispora brunnea TaxID=2905690 RepID=A0ABZ2K9P4_9BACT